MKVQSWLIEGDVDFGGFVGEVVLVLLYKYELLEEVELFFRPRGLHAHTAHLQRQRRGTPGVLRY